MGYLNRLGGCGAWVDLVVLVRGVSGLWWFKLFQWVVSVDWVVWGLSLDWVFGVFQWTGWLGVSVDYFV